jgi:nucleotide-binding universal stress UspA family protein
MLRHEVIVMFEKILLAVDGSESSERAVATAADLASSSNAEVIVLHVVEPAASKLASEVGPPEKARRVLDDAVRTLKERGTNVRGDLRIPVIGGVAHEIIDRAAAERADVIVMGSRGLSEWSGLILGSVTHKVLNLTSCPVLVTR